MTKKYRARHHNDIKRLLAKIRAEESAGADSLPDTRGVLDALNAFGTLEAVVQRPPGGMLCFGPRDYPCPDGAAVLMWHRPPGIGQHGTLGLLGVWAIAEASTTGGPVRVITGTRQVAYANVPFNVESYFYNLRRDFRSYYGRDTSPPTGEGVLLTATYTPAARLSLRHEIAAAVAGWRGAARA